MDWNINQWAPVASAMIALLALFRPEWGSLLRRWTNVIELHPTGRIEIGYSAFGPTLGLLGTLRAIANDQFISVIKITVIRCIDQAQHDFTWAVFRSPNIIDGQSQNYQIACGLLVSTDEAHQFSIQFHDLANQERIDEPLTNLKKLWIEYANSNNIMLRDLTATELRELFEKFRQEKKEGVSRIYNDIDRLFYWNEGEYKLRISVQTTAPSKKYEFNYGFQLSRAESENLRANVVTSIMAACNLPDIIYNFAFSRYMPIN